MRKNRILVVEDDIAISQMITLNLRAVGYEYKAFESGSDVLEHLKTDHAYDLVELNLLRVRDRYDYKTASCLPVWDFWATTGSHTEEEAYLYLNDMEPRHEIVLTINAIDGSIVDRELGY